MILWHNLSVCGVRTRVRTPSYHVCTRSTYGIDDIGAEFMNYNVWRTSVRIPQIQFLLLDFADHHLEAGIQS